MAFNTIYYGSFNDNVNQDRIDIYIKQDGFAGTAEKLLLDENPLLISYPSKEFDYQIFGCGAKINIINQSGDFYKYDSLFSVPERSNYVEVIKTPKSGDPSIYLFQGYILPEMYSSKLGKNIKLTIPATDRLSTLDRYTPWIFVDTSVYRAQEYIDALSIISSILYDADITNVIAVNNTLENINYRRIPGADTVFNNVWLQSDNFSESTSEIQDDKKCLENILKTFYSRVYYSNGKWMVERISDLDKDVKNFTVYPKEVSSYLLSVPNDRINISCHEQNALADSLELSYNPGYNKLITNLKFKKPESLVENIWTDFKYYTKEVSVNSTLPLPKQRRWMTSAIRGNVLVRPSVSYSGINNSVLWAKQIGGYLTDEEWFDEFFSTMFLFSPKSNISTDPTIINVAYKYGFLPTWASVATGFASDASQNATKILSRFALRACDRNGKDWWIAKSNPNDTSTYWKDTVYTFDTSISWADIKENNYILEVNEKIDISNPIITDVSVCTYYVKKHTNEGYWFYPFIEANPKDVWVAKTYTIPAKTQYIGELYLDIYDVFHNYRGLSPLHSNGWYYQGFGGVYMGDCDVDVATPKYPDQLEASMGYFYSTVTKELGIFDTSTILYTNGLYNIDSSENMRSIGKWRDSSTDNYIRIQEKYMEDLSQMLSTPKYKFSIDIRSKDSSLFTLGHLYNHDALRYPDNSLIDFMCNGLEYNVKENSYRLDLLEYVGDDNWRVNPATPYFSIDTSSISYTWDSQAGDKIVDISTNLSSWSIDSSEDWISHSISGDGPLWHCTIDCSQNIGGERDGSVWFIPGDASFNPQVVSIHQDVSSNFTLDISFNGLSATDASIILLDLPEGINVDISIYGFCEAYAYSDSYYCGDMASYADLAVNEISLAFAQTDQIDCGEDSNVNDSNTQLYEDASKGSAIKLSFSGEDYYAWNDGERMSNGYFIVSAVLANTSTPVEFIHNKIEWGTDHTPFISHT